MMNPKTAVMEQLSGPMPEGLTQELQDYIAKEVIERANALANTPALHFLARKVAELPTDIREKLMAGKLMLYPYVWYVRSVAAGNNTFSVAATSQKQDAVIGITNLDNSKSEVGGIITGLRAKFGEFVTATGSIQTATYRGTVTDVDGAGGNLAAGAANGELLATVGNNPIFAGPVNSLLAEAVGAESVNPAHVGLTLEVPKLVEEKEVFDVKLAPAGTITPGANNTLCVEVAFFGYAFQS